MTDTSDGRVRADAVRNRQAIIAAARAAIEDAGTDVALEEIARRAAINVRTLYRHFPTREDLLADVVENYFAERIEPALRRAIADPDPRRALTTTLTETTAAFVEHRTMFALSNSGARTAGVTARYLKPLSEILSRAQQAGVVRADIVPSDFPCLVAMLVAGAGPHGDDWSRYLALLLDGLAPEAASAPLPGIPEGSRPVTERAEARKT
ncbi:TetR/AcrR family transcriptional regulator [Nocardia speluncae]|uniref:TetR/AcrR family transcriptional regulator n=1 Tax=Nocardia speluncae TaxID=419477 RepID=A0A846XKT2_9NOCA|nr:TetR/AcrR family transcriptional regulator [Nocardia speluncae]NKY36921.1 TetR/AcrR family transcriptional regulator [Nocardia speluncae]